MAVCFFFYSVLRLGGKTMTVRILGSLALGIFVGLLFLSPENLTHVALISDWALALLLFTVGYDLGRDQELGKKIKELPKTALAVPFLIALGSIAGTMLVGSLFRLASGESAAIGAGFGWYSLSAVIISQTYDVALGALALLTNIFREILAIILIPFIARRFGFLPAVGPGGATTMDVTLPIIAKNCDAQTTLIAFYSGTVLTALVPIVVPLIIRYLAQ